MKKIVLVAMVIGLLVIGSAPLGALETKTYSGYTVVFNGETGLGCVYINASSTSSLFVTYPSNNVVYVYTKDGQTIIPYDKYHAEIEKRLSSIIDVLVSLIRPIPIKK